MSAASRTARPAPLRGRDAEREELGGLLEEARQGRGGASLLLGPAGIGKTALLDLAVALADGFTVLRAAGAAAETSMAFAGLHALLRPLTDSPEPPPGARGTVLRRALEHGRAAPGIALPAAVLDLLSAAARNRPLVVCVDDVHHLDAASRDALAFVARRLSGEPIAMLFAARHHQHRALGGGAVPGAAADLSDLAPVRVLAPLDAAAGRELVGGLVPSPLSAELWAALDRIAAGNPLALAETAAALTPAQLAGTAPPPEAPPRNGRLWRACADRLARLPAGTRWLLLLLAADPDLDAAALVRAAAPADAAEALEPAERTGIVTAVGPGCHRYGFAEPVMRPVVYHGASLALRRAAHRLLANVLDQDHHRLRRAWHRAAALDGPQEELGEELAAAAWAAQPYGGLPEPYRAFERAAELTGRGEVRAARLAAAARHAANSGRPDLAGSLLARLRTATVTAETRGRAELLRGTLELLGGETGSAHDRFLAAAGWLLDRDRELGVRALVRAADADYFAGDHRRFLAIARRAAGLRRPDDGPATRLMFEYLAGLSASFRGRHAEAAGPLRRVRRLAGPVRDPAMLAWAGVASLLLGEDGHALELAGRSVDGARRRGAVSALPHLLEPVIHAEVWTGRYASAAANAAEGLRLARETGRRGAAGHHLAWLALIAAVQGDEETCGIRAKAAFELADAHGLGMAAALGNWALAHLDLAAGRAGEAVARLGAGRRNGHVVVRVMAAPIFIEAAARTGERQRARAALRSLDRWAASTDSPDRLALALRCHALLAVPGRAETLFRDALDLHHRGACEFETARTQLLFGGALRRERRPGDARPHLRDALDTFERLGARLWAEQARAELRAAGQSVPAPAPPTASAGAGHLTAQQLQIARMVAEGATNREVAARLVLSPRTVEHHLRNIFARLGVRSRVELVRLLG
ncbi:helix-turn-helix transcriptional regulator [Streptosporangium pseudovulgare]|uniref:Transcriptional regulator n=1 Tax=Streptosporangium pseudovulgare TaxID=35765 RepID=A0ABQ2QLF8_9ACTN|nr:LuxR family transcriptional regulator [Streptosporangium pseudovulgare]GGP84302.1 transcriptional regulator [Streptosporangium pseudovulgare]